MAKTKEEVYAQNRADYALRKEVPECPRCESRLLEYKKGHPDEHFIWCKECRRKNRIYKGLLKNTEVQKLVNESFNGRQVEQKGGQAI